MRVTCAALIVLASGGTVAAQEKVPVESAVAGARALQAREQWGAAAAAWRAILDENPGSADALARLHDIEAGIIECLMRADVPEPTSASLLGLGPEEFSERGGRVRLSYEGPPKGDAWVSGRGVHLLVVSLAGDVSVDLVASATTRAEDKYGTTILLMYGDEGRAGYRVTPGFRFLDNQSGTSWELETTIERLDPRSGSTTIARRRSESVGGFEAIQRVSVRRSGARISVSVDGRNTLAAADGKLRAGRLVVGAQGLRSLRVEGTVEAESLQLLRELFWDDVRERWIRREYDRRRALPAWVLAAEAAAPKPAPTEKPKGSAAGGPAPSAAARRLLPTDAPHPAPQELRRVLAERAARRSDPFLEYAASNPALPPRTALYVRGLAAFDRGEFADAAALLTELLGLEPDFARARVCRGAVRRLLRDVAGAREDLDAAHVAGITDPVPAEERALLEIAAGSVAQAAAGLDAAAARAGPDERVDRLRRDVAACLKGPAWRLPYHHVSRHVNGSGNGTQATCNDAVREVLRACDAFAARLPGLAGAPHPLRVRVFADRAGFDAYAARLGRAPRDGVAHHRALGELILLPPEGEPREAYLRALWYECFHAFLAGAPGDVPAWVREGFAEAFAWTRGRGDAPPREADPAAWERVDGAPPPGAEDLRALLALRSDAPDAEDGSGTARASRLALLLLSPAGARHAPVLTAYTRSLARGLSAAQARDRDWVPALDRLAADFAAFLAAK